MKAREAEDITQYGDVGRHPYMPPGKEFQIMYIARALPGPDFWGIVIRDDGPETFHETSRPYGPGWHKVSDDV